MKRPCSEYLSDDFLDFATCTDVILTVSTYMEVFHVLLILKTFVNEIHRKDKIPQLHMYFLQNFSLTRQNSATSRGRMVRVVLIDGNFSPSSGSSTWRGKNQNVTSMFHSYRFVVLRKLQILHINSWITHVVTWVYTHLCISYKLYWSTPVDCSQCRRA